MTGASTGAIRAVVVAAAAFELWLAYRAFGEPTLLPQTLAAHAALSALLALAALTAYRLGERDPRLYLLVLALAAFGPVGALGGLVTVALHRRFAARATPFDVWHASLFPEDRPDKARRLHQVVTSRRAGPPRESTVAPFTDVIARGTVARKQSVLTLIADNFRPAFAHALLQALNDGEPAIRVQAAATAARLESGFLERSIALHAAQAARPDDPGTLLDLARHHDAYCASGLLDRGRADAVRQQALEHYERCRKLRPGDPQIAEGCARLMLETGRAGDAVAVLAPWLARDDAPFFDLVACHARCLYALGRYGELRALEPPRGGEAGDPVAVEALRLWAGGERAQAGLSS